MLNFILIQLITIFLTYLITIFMEIIIKQKFKEVYHLNLINIFIMIFFNYIIVLNVTKIDVYMKNLKIMNYFEKSKNYL